MIECPVCSTGFDAPDLPCPQCGFEVARILGFHAWAPELAEADPDEFFDRQHFGTLAEAESRHFWFVARNQLILWALRRYFGEPARLMEIGCGTGFVISAVERAFPRTQLVGTELFVRGLQFAAERCQRARLVQLDARRLPYRECFDVVGAFDVLEHIEQDAEVLEQIGRALVPGGGLILTVPQHRWLWSHADVAARHVRRYSAAELEGKVVAAGFEVLRSTSFVSLLLPVLYAARVLAPRKQGLEDELKVGRILNWLFGAMMRVDLFAIRLGFNLPFGGSRLIIARKSA